MWYFIFDLTWSQTDRDTVIVVASNIEDAKIKVRSKYNPPPRYINLIGKTQVNIIQ